VTGRRPAAVVLGALAIVACTGNSLPDRPTAHRPPRTTSTSTTTSSTTSTTTLPPVPVPGPVKAWAVCTVPHGVSTTVDGVTVFCVDRKRVEAKPYSLGRLRWTPSTISP
jgi:hypothetical protein